MDYLFYWENAGSDDRGSGTQHPREPKRRGGWSQDLKELKNDSALQL